MSESDLFACRMRVESLEARCRALEQDRDALIAESNEAFGITQDILGLEDAGDDPDDLLHNLRTVALRSAARAKDVDELRAAAQENEHLRQAIRTMVDRLDVIHADPLYQSVWTMFQIHGGDYRNGPKYDSELEQLRAMLTPGSDQAQKEKP